MLVAALAVVLDVVLDGEAPSSARSAPCAVTNTASLSPLVRCRLPLAHVPRFLLPDPARTMGVSPIATSWRPRVMLSAPARRSKRSATCDLQIAACICKSPRAFANRRVYTALA
jgi:hypothetical protein